MDSIFKAIRSEQALATGIVVVIDVVDIVVVSSSGGDKRFSFWRGRQ